MKQEPRIEILPEKKLVGKHLRMALAANRTGELWKSFMQCRKEITNNIGTDLISLQVYEPGFHPGLLNPQTPFEKWAVTEVTNFDAVPEGMDSIVLPGGLYAVFHHKGDASTGPQIFGYIYGTWLLQSEYVWDNRPQFELLGEKYRNNDPDSEEEIWIPVRAKA